MKRSVSGSKPFALLLVLLMLISLLPASALADETEYDSSDAVSFVFTDSKIKTEDTTHEKSYKIEGTALSIKKSGTFVLSGSCSDGSVTVKKGTLDVVLVLNGLELTNTGSENSATAPLCCNKSTGVTIIVAKGTKNTLTDSKYNNDDVYTSNEDAENAVIKCKDGSQVTIRGGGSLTIISNGKNGIKSGAIDSETDEANPKDASLTIEDLELNITANVNDAINAEQELNILSGTLSIASEDDAIHSDLKLTIGAEGTAGPTIKITKAYEGIEGSSISICSGDISILCSDDCINAANADLSDYSFELNISGGRIYAYTTEGDGFDSNGSLTISGGSVEVWSANTADNQPLDADGTVTISGGTVFAAGGSSGMGTKLNAVQSCISFGGSNGMQPGMRGGMQAGGRGTEIKAGSSVSVVSSEGTELYTTAAPCGAGYVVFSSPDVKDGGAYSLTADGKTVFDASAGAGSSGNGGIPSGGGSFLNRLTGFFTDLYSRITQLLRSFFPVCG